MVLHEPSQLHYLGLYIQSVERAMMITCIGWGVHVFSSCSKRQSDTLVQATDRIPAMIYFK